MKKILHLILVCWVNGLLLTARGADAGGPYYTFTTLAGLAGTGGSTDGTGSAARFGNPVGVAVDSSGNVYVADRENRTIRKITPGGVVSTLAGMAGNAGSADGTGSAARFGGPYGVAVDSSGNVYVADWENCTIRKITPGGVVNTVAGLAGSIGSADGTGSAARFNYPTGVAVDSTGNVYVADEYNCTIRKGVAVFAPALTVQPQSQTVTAGATAILSVSATGTAPLSYQWRKEAVNLAGATNANYSLANVQPCQAGRYTVVVSNSVGFVTSAEAVLTVGGSVGWGEPRLRAALAAGGAIQFDCDETVALMATLVVEKDTVLDGAGHAVTFSDQQSNRVFHVKPGAKFTLLSLTITEGRSDRGGGLFNEGGVVTVRDCVFSRNSAIGADGTNNLTSGTSDLGGGAGRNRMGGAIYNAGSFLASNTTFRANLARGGNGGQAGRGTNRVTGGPGGSGGAAEGGAIYHQEGSLTLARCVLVENQAVGGNGVSGGPSPPPSSLNPDRIPDDAGGPGGAGGGARGGALCIATGPAETVFCRATANGARGGLGGPGGPESGWYTTGVGRGGSGGFAWGGALFNQGMTVMADCALEQNVSCGGPGCAGRKASYFYSGSWPVLTFASPPGDAGQGGEAAGGAIFNERQLDVARCALSQNSAMGGDGGAGAQGEDGEATSYGRMPSLSPGRGGAGGTSQGGGLLNHGTANLVNTTFCGNSARGGAGAPLLLN